MIVVIPTCRPERRRDVAATLLRQRAQVDHVIIVENGPAVGAYADFPGIVTTSAPDVGAARRKGLEVAVEEFYGEFVAFLDDDDWYGPGYLEELLAHERRAEIIGKRELYYWFASTGALALCARGRSLQSVDAVHGATMAIRALPESLEGLGPVGDAAWGEDLRWQERQRELGARIFATSHEHYCGLRNVDPAAHTWCLPDIALAASLEAEMIFRGPGFGVVVKRGERPAAIAGEWSQSLGGVR